MREESDKTNTETICCDRLICTGKKQCITNNAKCPSGACGRCSTEQQLRLFGLGKRQCEHT